MHMNLYQVNVNVGGPNICRSCKYFFDEEWRRRTNVVKTDLLTKCYEGRFASTWYSRKGQTG